MKNQNEFEWLEFTDLGMEYLNETNRTKQRTGISRFYYGAFCSSRDFLNENKTYLDEKSEKIMTSKNVDVHRETSKIFKNHPKFKKENKGKIISKNLNKLRKMRNQADYDKTTEKPLSKMINESKRISDIILDSLKNLNWIQLKKKEML